MEKHKKPAHINIEDDSEATSSSYSSSYSATTASPLSSASPNKSPSPKASSSHGVLGLFKWGSNGSGLNAEEKIRAKEERKREKDKKKEVEFIEKEKKRRAKARVEALRQKLEQPILQESKESNERSSPFDAQPGEPTTIIADNIDALPANVKASLERMKVPFEKQEEHFATLLNILSFTDKCNPKRRYYTTEQWEVISHPDYDRKKAKNLNPASMLIAVEELYEKITMTEANKIFKWGKHLGDGGFGEVIAAKVSKSRGYGTRGKVAVKHQNIKGAQNEAQSQHECSILKHCKHPNICETYHYFRVGDEAWIVMELMEGGTLKKAAESPFSCFEEPEIAYVAGQMLKAIDYLHKNDLAHRDLKNSNVMMTVEGVIKLIDFGLCADFSKGPQIQMVGSPFWMAPEMIRGEPHSYPVDIWSFVICMLELANHRPPNSSNVKRAMFTTATDVLPNCGLKEPGRWGPEFKDFLQQGLERDQKLRPTAATLLQHPFLKKATTREKMKRMLGQIFISNTLSVGLI